MKNLADKKVKAIIWIIMLASTLALFYGEIIRSPQSVKSIFALSMWSSMFMYPIYFVKNGDFDKQTKFLLKSIFLLALISIIRSFLLPDEFVVGNKYISMFANEECLFSLLSPGLIVLAQSDYSIVNLRKASYCFLILGVIGLLSGKVFMSWCLWWIFSYFPYVDKKYKVLICISAMVMTYRAFFAEETSRTGILIIAFAIASYYFTYILKNRKMINLFCYSILVMVTFYSILTLIEPEFSIFEIVLNYLSGTTGDEFAVDTRTFLFREMSDDLTNNDCWLLGKGAYSHYYSPYFERSSSGNSFFFRMSSEVTLLHLLMRGGLIYVTVYYCIIVYAIHKSLRKSQNKFLLSASVILTGWVLVSCMGYCNGYNIKHVGIFLLAGCCLSNKWLSKTDDEIKSILK